MDWEPFARIGIAALLALPLGLDRELRGKAAGLKTNVVVAIACAGLGHLSLLTAEGSPGNDGTRIASQTIAGIGFIGAGVIFASKGQVRGLTTAAAAFGAAAIGLAAGMGEYSLGAAIAAITMVVLLPVQWIAEKLIEPRALGEHTVQWVAEDVAALGRAERILQETKIELQSLDVRALGERMLIEAIIVSDPGDAAALRERLAADPGVLVLTAQLPER